MTLTGEPMCGDTPKRIGHTYAGIPPWMLPKPGQRCCCGDESWPQPAKDPWALLARAAHVAENLMGMIDRQAWRDTGGDDGQGHYEGEYRAEKLADEIRSWASIAAERPGSMRLVSEVDWLLGYASTSEDEAWRDRLIEKLSELREAIVGPTAPPPPDPRLERHLDNQLHQVDP